MKKICILPVILAGAVSLPALAGTPVMGDREATAHQTCGRAIEVQIVQAGRDGNGNEQTVLGLTNRKTGRLDLFLSESPAGKEPGYSRYRQVVWDALSQTWLTPPGKAVYLLRGSSVVEMTGIRYSLSLGSHVYDCTAPEAWPDETADRLYGEPASGSEPAPDTTTVASGPEIPPAAGDTPPVAETPPAATEEAPAVTAETPAGTAAPAGKHAASVKKPVHP